MSIFKMYLVECTLTGQALTDQKKCENFNKPTTQESSSPSGGGCEICAIVFLQQMFTKF